MPVPGGYYIYSTNRRDINVPMLFSPDLEQFTLLGDAMPTLPHWAQPGLTWAPEVTKVHGQYRLYFTARLKRSRTQVIGVAVSDQPQGPFVATRQPFIQMREFGGAIDPAVLNAPDGREYVYWKNDGNAVGQPTYLWGAALSLDGLTLAGTPRKLLAATESWEHDLVEAPQVVEHQGTYHLLYSCADFGDESYAVGHASSSSPLGPFRKTREAPILASYGQVAGPGHSHAFQTASGHWHLAYHGWEAGSCGYPRGRRSLYLSPLQFSGRQATVHVSAHAH
ncbi:glycoside hydrolase family 43 protein [Deinococcus altitudinis]|uniref:glycoside hydrolase family 43 protein n=1 Tax=Deinococcus altitudinis TaxID=468914 RepID=UPI0038914B27